ncbi:MAG: hypothetical protein ACPGO5_05490 [Patescibacteria group bacterium]
MPLSRIRLLLIITALIVVPGISSAQTSDEFLFNPNNIISDGDFFKSGTMTESDIQAFLESKNSHLASMVDSLTQMKPSRIISLIAGEYGINPKVILTKLQKEQSLIENGGGAPSQDAIDWAMGYAICDSCSKSDPALQDFKGLFNQIKYGTAILKKYEREILEQGQTRSGFAPGKASTVDGTLVTPANTATALLYTYTPHLHGNKNFAKIYQKWFPGLAYPNGTLLQAIGEAGVYLIQDGVKKPFHSKAALTSRGYKLDKVLQVDQQKLDAYTTGTPIKYPQYALLASESGQRYLLVNDKKRPFADDEVFRKLGFNPEELEIVPDEDLSQFPDGNPITLADAYPTGALVQNNQSGAVYFVEAGYRYAIIDKSIMDIRFGTKPAIISADPVTLKSYIIGPPLPLHDGELVISETGDPAVYVIAGGQRLPIVSGKVFEELGYSWEDIVSVPQKVIDLHPLGTMIQQDESSDVQTATN